MLNSSQQIAFDRVVDFIASEEKVLSILGGAGTGKSFLIDYLNYNIDNLVLTATTNEASNIIGGMTIHKLLGFGIKDIQEYPSKYNEGDIVLIDEASMLPVYIMKKLVQMEVKVILVGDPRQLVVGINVQIDSYPFVYLTKNMRASTEALANLVDELTTAVETEVPVMLKEHLGDHLEFIDDHSRFVELIKRKDDESKVLAYTNKVVDSYIENVGCGLTAHKAQGKSYNVVYFDTKDLVDNYTKPKNRFNNPLSKKNYLRLLLVGISRARKKVYCYTGNKRWQS